MATSAVPTSTSFAYRELSEGTRTVEQLWREWTVGSAIRPSIEGMDQLHGRKAWLLDANAKKKYDRRFALIRAIRSSPLYTPNSFPHAAIQAYEDRRRGYHINSLCTTVLREKPWQLPA